MALDDSNTVTINEALCHVMHELAAVYEYACTEHGDDSERAVIISDAIIFMRGWMRRYSAATQQ